MTTWLIAYSMDIGLWALVTASLLWAAGKLLEDG